MMDYRDGYLSDEYDDMDGFLSEDSEESIHFNGEAPVAPELTKEQKLKNLFYYIINGNLLAVIESLNSGIDVHTILQDRWKPIVLAASIGNYEIVLELINRGADVNDHRDYCTVLMFACNCPEATSPFENSYNIVAELIERGANVDAVSRRRETALLYASSTGNVLAVQKLLSCCNVSAEDNRGWNALFWAADANQPQIVQILLDAGFEGEKHDLCGNNALYYATMQEYKEVIEILSVPSEDVCSDILTSTYDLENLFEDNARPQFLQDCFSMLYGMGCESLQTLFVPVSLLDFLSLNDEKLIKIGVVLPYQRNRILGGLYKFHKHLFKQKSIPMVPKNSLYTSIDVSYAVLTAIRHLTVMEASLLYILQSNFNTNTFHGNISSIRIKIKHLKKTVASLNMLTKKWDGSNKPVDLITENSKNRSSWLKRIAGFSIILVGTTLFIHKYL